MKIAQQVENILRFVPQTRSSDKELLIIYMQKCGMELTDKQMEVFRDMPSLESIRRVRQKLQEEGKYPASKEIEEHRYSKYQETTGSIGVINADQTADIINGRRIKEWGEY